MDSRRTPGERFARASVALVIMIMCSIVPLAPTWSREQRSPAFQRDPSFSLRERPREGSRYVRIKRAGALRTPDGPALLVQLTSIAARPILVAVSFDPPGREFDCTSVADLPPAGEHRYVCPIPILEAGMVYPVTIEVRSPGGRRPIERIRHAWRFEQGHLAALAGRPDTPRIDV
jgi:hypothetical protein